ncbi:hypothetical protein F5880DRAFT_156849 [Lentinula raphanica]|nr:hypothetical protein F5880DRAFT_156849 [Lentinula raphanica]
MATRSRQLFYACFILISILIGSLLDRLKQSYANVIRGLYIDIALFSLLPLSFFVTVISLPVRRSLEGSTQSGQPKDTVALLGCVYTWLNLSRLVSGTPFIRSLHTLYRLTVSSDPAISSDCSSCTIPSPLFFAFCYRPNAIVVSLLLTIIFYGLCLHACGINERRWGYFESVYSTVMYPLKGLLDLFQHNVTFFRGGLGQREGTGQRE